MDKKIILNKTVIIFLFFFLFCSKVGKNKETFSIALPSEPTTIDPLYATDLMSRKLNLILFSKLLVKDSDLGFKNDIIEYYKIDKNKLFIKLNDVGFNSNDVFYSLSRAKKENHPTKSNYNIIQNIEKINDKDIIINFSSSKEELLDLLSTVSSSIYYEDSHKKGEFKSEGKFKLEKWVRNNFMILTENLNLPAIPPRIQLKFLQNSATAIFLFSRNELDLLKLPYHIASHPSLKDGKLNFVKGKSVQYVAINNTDECFDVHFRRAVNFGIDRKKIIEKVFDSFAEEVYFPFPERYLHKNISRDKYKLYFNLEKAKNELQRSRCYPYILNRELDFRMRGDDENKAKGLAITQNLRDIGLKVKINPMEKAPLYKENGQKKGDLTLLTWYIDFDSALNFIDPLFSSDSYGNGGNRSFYKNKAMDEIISKGRINYNLTEDLQIRSLDLLKKDYPWIFLWSIYEIYLVSPRLSENYQIEDLFF